MAFGDVHAVSPVLFQWLSIYRLKWLGGKTEIRNQAEGQVCSCGWARVAWRVPKILRHPCSCSTTSSLAQGYQFKERFPSRQHNHQCVPTSHVADLGIAWTAADMAHCIYQVSNLRFGRPLDKAESVLLHPVRARNHLCGYGPAQQAPPKSQIAAGTSPLTSVMCDSC